MASSTSMGRPTPRKGHTALSSSLRHSVGIDESMLAGPSSEPFDAKYAFRPHLLLNPDALDLKKVLDFGDISTTVDNFAQRFRGFQNNVIRTAQEGHEMHGRRVQEQRSGMEDIRLKTEKQKDVEKHLIEAIGREEDEDKAARMQVQQLLSQQSSTIRRIDESRTETESLQAALEKRHADKRDKAARLQREISRNVPELAKFGKVLGCYISGVPSDPKLLEFKFNLINPDDWSFEARFHLDVGTRDYKVTFCEPSLPKEKLEHSVTELNASREIWTFIKEMRMDFREEAERMRAEKRSLKRKELDSTVDEGRM